VQRAEGLAGAKGTEMFTGRMTAEQMDRGVGKSFIEDIDILPTNVPGAYLSTSGSEPGKVYHLTERYCECKGHEYRGYCKHRARLLFELGPDYQQRYAGVTAGGQRVDWLGLELEAHKDAKRDIRQIVPRRISEAEAS